MRLFWKQFLFLIENDNLVNKQEILKNVRSMGRGTLGEALGIEITDIGKEYVSGKMPVDHRTKQPFGLLHGGASVALAETLGSIGALMQIDTRQNSAVGIDINASHLRSVNDGWVHGTANMIRAGNKIQVWDIEIVDDNKNLVCKSRLTVANIRNHVK